MRTPNHRHQIVGGRILVAAALLALAPATSLAQCDVPLIAQQVSVAPNVMILMDNSGSMNEMMWHADYDPSIEWPGNFTAGSMYYVGSDGTYAPSAFNSSWPSSPKLPLRAGLHGQWGRYIGNYLNWAYFNSTPEQQATFPTITRQMVANTAVQAVISQAVGLRYGIARFNVENGGKVVANCGTSTADLFTIIDNMVANTWTPTAETLFDVMSYFQDAASGPIQYECQKNFVIVVTDGFPTKDLNIPAWIGDQDGDGAEPGTCESIGAPNYGAGTECSDYLDDVAYYMAHNDMRGDLTGDQIVNVYTIGFGIDAPLLWQTAENGDGLYRVAWNLDTLIQELGTVVGDIVNRISSGAAVAVVSTEAGTDNHLYRGKFMPGLWRGFLEAFDLPYSPASSPIWEAGSLLKARSANSRTIFTNVNNGRVDFTDTSADVLMPYLLASSLEQSADIINYVRGDPIAAQRDRNGWKLGDLVYSTPLVVGPPTQFFFEPSYQDFLNALSNREMTVYAGSNDGMLHAFRAADGYELWSYVPTGVLGKLSALMDPNYCHQTYVDLSPVAYDVKIGGVWKTVLIGGERTGGDSYFALDITDPYSPAVLWETAVPKLTTSFTEPTLVRTPTTNVIWTGSGPDLGGSAYASGLLLDDGNILVDEFLGNIANVNMATAAVAFDVDSDGYHDLVYQADLAGNLWRFDVRDINNITYHALYTGDQPIQGRPTLAVNENGEVFVYFGTGRYLDSADVSNTAQQYFNCVRDDMTGAATFSHANGMINQTGIIHDVADADGWYFALENGPGERVVEPTTVVEGVVYFTAFAPSDLPCTSGGESWLYKIDFSNGDSVDEDGNGVTSNNTRSESLGSGVASKPVINLNGSDLIVQTSDARLNINQLSVTPKTILVRAWRERLNDTATGTTSGGTN